MVSRIDAGDVLEETRLRDVAFTRRRQFRSLFLAVAFARPETKQTGSRRALGCRKSDVGRIGRECFDVPEEFLCGFCRIEAQSGDLSVIDRCPHRVECGSGRFVVAQIVDGVAPERESGSAFRQDQLDSSLTTRFRTTQIQQDDWNAGELQLPIGQFI